MLNKLKTLMQKSDPAGITINGRSFSGNNVSIVNGKVTIDGKRVDVEERDVKITVTVNGNIGNLEMDSGEVTVQGDVGEIKTASGSVMCQDVKGGVQTASGNVSCTDVYADITTRSGNVRGSTIHGSVKTVTGNISG